MKKRILVINDTQEFLRRYDVVLSAEGYDVLTEVYEHLDMALIEGLCLDVVILDFIVSNKARALNILHFLKSQSATVSIPILLCTIWQHDIAHIPQGFSHGEVHSLFKPFDVNDLLVKVHQCLHLMT